MRTVTTDQVQCVITEKRLIMGQRTVCKGILLILLVQIQGYASQTTTETSSSSAMNSSEEDLSVHPGWWFPPVQFEHIILEPNDSDEQISNPDGLIIGGDLSFIISKGPPAYFISDNSTENGTDIMNATSFIAVEESFITMSNGSVVEEDYIPFMVFPADDITAEILSPAMVDQGPPMPTPAAPGMPPAPMPAAPGMPPAPMPATPGMPPAPRPAAPGMSPAPRPAAPGMLPAPVTPDMPPVPPVMDNSTEMTTPKLDTLYSDS